ncbi:MAG TPA: hypothetical protein VNW46_18370 [Gemmatimonadaceae bacterium]|jgi:hypothetical protein|nr:hypothetical protein [Gemmatimonadaceae bacterium]
MPRDGVVNRRLRRRVAVATTVLAVLIAGALLVTCPGHVHGNAVVARDSTPRLPDLTGTWVINIARSTFGGPPPKADTATYKRDGYVYHVTQAVDQGQGLVHLESQWPTDSGEVTDSLPDGTIVHVKAHVERGVQLFTMSLAQRGQTATMSGRIEVAPDRATFTRYLTVVPSGGEPVNLRLVYVKKS